MSEYEFSLCSSVFKLYEEDKWNTNQMDDIFRSIRELYWKTDKLRVIWLPRSCAQPFVCMEEKNMMRRRKRKQESELVYQRFV